MDAKIVVVKAAGGSHGVEFSGTWSMRELDRVYRAMQLGLRGHHLAERMRAAAGMQEGAADAAGGAAGGASDGADGHGRGRTDTDAADASDGALDVGDGGMGSLGASDAPSVWDGLLEGRAAGAAQEQEGRGGAAKERKGRDGAAKAKEGDDDAG